MVKVSSEPEFEFEALAPFPTHTFCLLVDLVVLRSSSLSSFSFALSQAPPPAAAASVVALARTLCSLPRSLSRPPRPPLLGHRLSRVAPPHEYAVLYYSLSRVSASLEYRDSPPCAHLTSPRSLARLLRLVVLLHHSPLDRLLHQPATMADELANWAGGVEWGKCTSHRPASPIAHVACVRGGSLIELAFCSMSLLLLLLLLCRHE